ncbi:hypothetical protein B296_00029887 [Ensete ventricosum]|uniref:Uncharacterized protein n=1 Tax=Ensete ventricosum TaxID=4639 RepID=A0A426XUS4_ENSVE|nr:hypothetical protein B296_00029887 [Ensete ventricosum]
MGIPQRRHQPSPSGTAQGGRGPPVVPHPLLAFGQYIELRRDPKAHRALLHASILEPPVTRIFLFILHSILVAMKPPRVRPRMRNESSSPTATRRPNKVHVSTRRGRLRPPRAIIDGR